MRSDGKEVAKLDRACGLLRRDNWRLDFSVPDLIEVVIKSRCFFQGRERRRGLEEKHIMVRNKPAGDAFASNRRSPASLRRKREMELKAAEDGGEFITSLGEIKSGSGLRRSLSSTSRLTLFSFYFSSFYFF